jgi:putative ABC transport system permease protein
MNISRLVVQEIAHRFLNFVLAVVGVSIAVACLVASVTMIDAGEIESKQLVAKRQKDVQEAGKKAEIKSKQLVAKRQKEVQEAGKRLNDEMRKITKGLGFNIVVLAEDEDIAAFHAHGTPTGTMPQEYVTRLANSPIVVINHLLPIVTRKIQWAEQKQTIVLTGTRGEVPQAHRDPKKPLLDLVPKGKIVLGYRLHHPRKLKPGSKLTLNGRDFQVAKCHAERGTVDDVTAWVNLEEAQDMLGMQNLVNAILALECNCATIDRLAEIRTEIAKVLPGTQILERGRKALARAEARNKAKKTADAALVAAEESGQQMIDSQKKTADAALVAAEESGQQIIDSRKDQANVLVPLAVVGSFAWIVLLAVGNARQRRSEIGILRAIGLGRRAVLVLFLGKALLVGLAGGAIGYASGFLIGTGFSGSLGQSLFDVDWLLIALIIAPALSAAATWLPALVAAGQDPAIVLQEQ